MERVKHKSKRDKQQKQAYKDNSSSFITDVKSIKENLKIKEILRTVKMNSSMRIKAPRGSKVMNNKDFNHNDDIFEEDYNHKAGSVERLQAEPSPSATNRDVVLNPEDIDTVDTKEIKTDASDHDKVIGLETNKHEQNQHRDVYDNHTNETCMNVIPENEDIAESSTDSNIQSDRNTLDRSVYSTLKLPADYRHTLHRDRKLSLDQTMLTRREGLSQSELDLHSIGKSPLERKSSFFRKKMESFFKNTTEIFKRQSMSGRPDGVQRRGSMSASLQSLNEKSSDYSAALKKNNQGSSRSLRSSSTLGRSTTSLSASQAALASEATASEAGASDVGASEAGTSEAGMSEAGSLACSQPLLSVSQPLENVTADSMQSLQDAYAQDSFLNSRAISMSSGLDSAHSSRRRRSNSNRSNRVTWLASEGLAHYFRRLIQDEKSQEMQVCHSYSDFTTIPENELYGPRLDAKGRRLSYQRAVSGEDPAASLRRRGQQPQREVGHDLAYLLSEFTRHGVPPLTGFNIANIEQQAFEYLEWAAEPSNLEEFYDSKQLPPMEECRQAVIRELVSTEALHIKHLRAIVEVFIAAAHALQDAGKLLDIDTERLFMNIPDVLNASLIFWESAMYPMIADAVQHTLPFNTDHMSDGFARFREIFAPYELFVTEQTKVLDYLRAATQAGGDFVMYLAWCHSQKECNRLQLADILVKPMQRLTKYSLILRRIITYTDTEPERTSLIAMERFAKNYVLDLNRSIRQRDELEKLENLANSIESYEVDYKDEDLDRYFRMFSQTNLRSPMQNCIPGHSRSIIYEGDLRYKDKDKEMEVRVFLLTDMMLITKKQKGSVYPFKMVRPKYFVDKLIHCCKPNPKNPKEIVALIFVLVDEVSSSVNAFLLTDTQTNKDPNAPSTLKLWDTKVKEAKLTYEIAVWWAKNPSCDLTDVDLDSSSEYANTFSGKSGHNKSSEELTIEKDARERVAAMLHRMHLMGASTEYDFSQTSMHTDSFDGHGPEASTSAGRMPGIHSIRYPMYRTSTGGSSRQSRLSSFHYSTSAASHDEPQAGSSGKNIYRTGSSVEHLIPPLNRDDGAVTSITVNVVGESESEATEPQPPPANLPPPPPPRSGAGRGSPVAGPSGAGGAGAGNTLRVHGHGGALAFVHSLPDLTVDPSPSPTRPSASPSPQSASDKLYQSHQELLQRNRLSASQQQFLSPHHRGTSYPPPSPTRASLRRGLAFSYSLKNPPLSKMGHVNSQSQAQVDHAAPSTSAAAHHAKGGDRGAVTPPPPPAPAPPADKPEKKSKQFISRNKGNSKGSSSTAGKSAGGASSASPVAGTSSTSAAAGTSDASAPAGASVTTVMPGAGGGDGPGTSSKAESSINQPSTAGAASSVHPDTGASSSGIEVTFDLVSKAGAAMCSSANTASASDEREKANVKSSLRGKLKTPSKRTVTGSSGAANTSETAGTSAGTSGAPGTSGMAGTSGTGGMSRAASTSGEAGTSGAASTTRDSTTDGQERKARGPARSTQE